MTNNLLELEKGAQGIYKLFLNHPETKNSMNEQMAVEFLKIIHELKKDKKLRVLVLSGRGEMFSAGGNLEMLKEKIKIPEEKNKEIMMGFYNSFLSLTELNVPVIAAINGHAVGAALCLSLACDIRVAVDTAKLAFNFVLLGLHPGMGATYFLPRLIGPAKAAELLFLGKSLIAEEAYKIGLINQVVSKDNFWSTVDNLAEQILAAGPLAISSLKESLKINEQTNLQTALSREAKCQAKSFASAEFLEGITAIKEKRKPKF